MKRIVILLIFFITLTNCVEPLEEYLYETAVETIDKAIETDEPAHDTFLRVENNSNFTFNFFEIGFDDISTVVMYNLLPDEIYPYTGFSQISDSPYIRFTINTDEYIREFKNPTNYITSGNFVIKIDIISTSDKTFSFKIEQE